jgi:hypothetical protein
LSVQVIWWVGIGLEALLLVRGVLGGWAPRNRVFYFYILFVLTQEILRFFTYQWNSQSYLYVYWVTEFLGILVGCGIVFEIYRIGLAAYPGTARMARNLLFLIFVLTFTKAFVDASSDPRWWPIASTLDLERDARVVQACAIAALAGLFALYSVPYGRNLRGVVLGYGTYVTFTIVPLTFAAAKGGKFLVFWYSLVPLSYLLALVIWATHLWSFQPQPAPSATVRLEHDYQKVAAATRRRLQEARGYLGKATL